MQRGRDAWSRTRSERVGRSGQASRQPRGAGATDGPHPLLSDVSELVDELLERDGLGLGDADDHDGVIPGDRAGHVGQARGVDGGRNPLGGPAWLRTTTMLLARMTLTTSSDTMRWRCRSSART